LKHNWKVILLASLIVCLIVTIAVTGCGGAKTGAKSEVYTASFGKMKVTLTVPAETNSTTSVIEKVNRNFAPGPSAAGLHPTLASYKVDNGSSRPTLCDDYSFGLTFGDGPTTATFNVKEVLENQLKIQSNPPDKALLSQGTSVLKRLQNTNEVKQGHSGTAYYYFVMLPGLSGAKHFTMTSKETHETKVMTKQ
jgi:hypothetical protein